MCKAIGYKLSLEDIEAHSLFDKEDNKKMLCMFAKKSDFLSMLESGGIDLSQVSSTIVDKDNVYTTVHLHCPLPLGNPFFASLKIKPDGTGMH